MNVSRYVRADRKDYEAVKLDAAPVSDVTLAPDGRSAFHIDVESWPELLRELDRARRYEREFALVRLPNGSLLERRKRVEDANQRRAEALLERVRTIDSVWRADEAVYLLLPETDRETGERLLARLVAEVPQLLPSGGSVVSFPSDGLTTGALLGALNGAGENGRARL